MSQLLQADQANSSAAFRSRSNESYLPVTPYTTGIPDNRRSAKTSGFGSSSVRPMQQQMPAAPRSVDNPLSALISDELFNTLLENDLLNEKALRDFMIRQQFKKLKAETNMRTMEVMNEIQRLYPYLQLDTIRKIVYRVYPTSGKKPML